MTRNDVQLARGANPHYRQLTRPLDRSMSNAIKIRVGDEDVWTLRDILPNEPGLRMLFVAKTPAPVSVEEGHYFQGSQGRAFWNRLREFGLLNPMTEFEDDSLLAHGYGLTDIVKVPRSYGNEPSDAEYRSGMNRILELITQHKPRVVTFVYKGVLDNVLRLHFGIRSKAEYGFNPSHERSFGTRVFAFPLPGVGNCNRAQAVAAMSELRRFLESQ